MSEYDSRAIEKKATNEVDRFFENSNVVATYINDGDKEPFFDGHLYLYGGGKRNNEHYTGRVAVQVKGRDMGEFKDSIFSYPIEMLDLKAYLHEGIAYFVVQEVGKDKRLYYRLLTPVELRTIIQDNAGQKTVSVRMNRAYDHEIKTIEIELIQFEHDCKMQVSYADAPIFNFEDFGKNGIHSFSIDLELAGTAPLSSQWCYPCRCCWSWKDIFCIGCHQVFPDKRLHNCFVLSQETATELGTISRRQQFAFRGR